MLDNEIKLLYLFFSEQIFFFPTGVKFVFWDLTYTRDGARFIASNGPLYWINQRLNHFLRIFTVTSIGYI